MAKRKLEAIEAEGDLAYAKNEQQAGRELLRAKIESLIKRYRDISSLMESLKVDELATALQQIKDSNPMTTVRLQSNLIKSKTMAARLKQDIYLSYIEYLSYSEVLQQRPLINFLSPTGTLLSK